MAWAPRRLQHTLELGGLLRRRVGRVDPQAALWVGAITPTVVSHAPDAARLAGASLRAELGAVTSLTPRWSQLASAGGGVDLLRGAGGRWLAVPMLQASLGVRAAPGRALLIELQAHVAVDLVDTRVLDASLCAEAEATPSSVGCSFFANRMDNFQNLKPDSLIVGNTSKTLTAEVQLYFVPDGSNTEQPEGAPLQLLPGKTLEFHLTNAALAKVSVLRKGGVYRVQSTIPIVAYQHSPIGAQATNDASMLLPEHALRRDHIIASYPNSIPAEAALYDHHGLRQSIGPAAHVEAREPGIQRDIQAQAVSAGDDPDLGLPLVFDAIGEDGRERAARSRARTGSTRTAAHGRGEYGSRPPSDHSHADGIGAPFAASVMLTSAPARSTPTAASALHFEAACRSLVLSGAGARVASSTSA